MASGRRTKPKSGDTEHEAPKPGAEEDKSASSRPNRKLAEQLKDNSDDPDEVRGALDDAAGMSRNLWLTFLSFGTFLVVTVGAVKHSDLLRESPIKLPLVDVELPLFAFFWVAPLLVLIFHAYLLLNLKLMVDNVYRYNAMLKAGALKPDEEDNFRLLLTNFPFVQLLAGTSYSRQGFLGWLLATIVWITVVLAPLVLLLLMQLQFLPYHSSLVTWIQRIVIAIDLLLLWYFWPKIMAASPRSEVSPRSRVQGRVVHWLAITGTALIFIFTWGVATFPGEPLDKNFIATAAWVPWPCKPDAATNNLDAATNNCGANQAAWTLKSPYELLFLGDINEVTASRDSLWSNTIVVPNEDFVVDTQLDAVDRTIPLRGRDLRGAILVRADLRKADFTGAILDGADLSNGRFDQAYFYCAKRNSPNCTSLLNAKLDEASLVGAKLHNAHLEGASLKRTKLQLADLTDAHLEGASLKRTKLQLADLTDANLQGADLTDAHLEGASLKSTKLQGADLRGAQLQGARLFDPQSQNPDMAQLQGTNLRDADVWLVDFPHDLANQLPAPLGLADLKMSPLTPKAKEQLKQDLDTDITDPVLLPIVTARLEQILRNDPPNWGDENSWQEYISKAKEPSAEELARFHAGLACDDTDGYVATSMAGRAKAFESEHFGKGYAKPLATALLDETCAGGKALTDETPEKLTNLISLPE